MRTAPSSTRQHFQVRSGAAVNVPFLRRVIHQTLSCRIFSSSLDNSTYGSYVPFSDVRARRCSRAAENNQPGALTRQLMKPWRHRATGGGQRSSQSTATPVTNNYGQQAIAGGLLRTVPLRHLEEGFATETPERQHGRPRPRPHNSQLGLSECYALAVHNYGTVSLNEF